MDPNWTDKVSAIANVVVALAAIVAAVAAVPGITAWRRELTGRRRFELAEETLAHIYEARDTISWMRNPSSYESETAELARLPNEDDSSFQLRRTYAVAQFRYSQKSQIFAELEAAGYRVAAVFGPEFKKPIDDLIRVAHRVLLAGQQASQWAKVYAKDFASVPEDQLDPSEKLRKYESIYWGVGDDEDSIAAEVDKIVTEAVRLFSPVLSEDR